MTVMIFFLTSPNIQPFYDKWLFKKFIYILTLSLSIPIYTYIHAYIFIHICIIYFKKYLSICYRSSMSCKHLQVPFLVKAKLYILFMTVTEKIQWRTKYKGRESIWTRIWEQCYQDHIVLWRVLIPSSIILPVSDAQDIIKIKKNVWICDSKIQELSLGI